MQVVKVIFRSDDDRDLETLEGVVQSALDSSEVDYADIVGEG